MGASPLLNPTATRYKMNQGKKLNKEKIAAYQKGYREANKGKIAARGKAYYEANKERSKEYREANKEEIAAKDKEYREANKEKIAARKKAYDEANKEELKEYREANKEEIAAYKKAYNEANKEELATKRKAYYEANKEKEALRKKVYYAANREKVNSRNKAYKSKPENSNRANFLKRERRKNSPTLRISDSVSGQIRQQIKNKNQRTVFSLLGYSLKDLMNHLEAQFKSNMTWENYGTLWHIDHIIPISWFKFETTDDAEFEKCWSLSNLQPLLASINLSKGNRYAG